MIFAQIYCTVDSLPMFVSTLNISVILDNSITLNVFIYNKLLFWCCLRILIKYFMYAVTPHDNFGYF